MWSEMYQRGYDNSAISFAYIPDFKSEKERLDFNRGLKDGYAKIELLKSGNIAQQGQPEKTADDMEAEMMAAF